MQNRGMNRSGIYEIRNTANGKRYVGSATSFRGRFATHLSYLRRGIHHNRYLQAAWSKHGEAAFQFMPLLYCAPADLLMYEQRALDGLAPEYNLSPTAANTRGTKWSEETRARVAASRRNDHFSGRKHSPETLALMSERKRGNTATKGKKRNASAVEKSAAAHRGMKRTPEARARMAIAMQAAWARKRA